MGAPAVMSVPHSSSRLGFCLTEKGVQKASTCLPAPSTPPPPLLRRYPSTQGALLEAAYLKDSTAVARLLSAGVHPDANCVREDTSFASGFATPLLYAVDNHDAATCHLLLCYEAFTNEALYRTIENQDITICKLLLEADVDLLRGLDEDSSVGGESLKVNLVAHLAAAPPEMVELLVRHGMDAENDVNKACLAWAASQGNKQVSQLLMNGAVQRALDAALYAASCRGHTEIVTMLLGCGADPLADGVFYAFIDAAGGGYSDVCKILLDHVDINMVNGAGETALIKASQSGMESVVQLLLREAAVEVRDATGATALMHAARRGYENICSVLLAHNADIDASDHHGDTPLMDAAYHGHTDLCVMLAAQGCEVLARNLFGETALVKASYAGHSDTLRTLLLSSGVSEVLY